MAQNRTEQHVSETLPTKYLLEEDGMFQLSICIVYPESSIFNLQFVPVSRKVGKSLNIPTNAMQDDGFYHGQISHHLGRYRCMSPLINGISNPIFGPRFSAPPMDYGTFFSFLFLPSIKVCLLSPTYKKRRRKSSNPQTPTYYLDMQNQHTKYAQA